MTSCISFPVTFGTSSPTEWKRHVYVFLNIYLCQDPIQSTNNLYLVMKKITVLWRRLIKLHRGHRKGQETYLKKE